LTESGKRRGRTEELTISTYGSADGLKRLHAEKLVKPDSRIAMLSNRAARRLRAVHLSEPLATQ
jgi:hypothetical protein